VRPESSLCFGPSTCRSPTYAASSRTLARLTGTRSSATTERAWRTIDGNLAALATGEIEVLLLVPWNGEGAPPAQSSYVYVEDPDALCAEFEESGADVVDPVASRPYGMRDFVVRDPDGHRFTLGRGEEALRDVADYYGLDRDGIAVDPPWLQTRQR
jgi:Glyoxalase-like domain